MEQYNSIHYLRGFASLMVVLYHAMITSAVAQHYSKHYGDFGVDVFFVISGFVMWLTTERSYKGILPFWKNRLIRVVPLYWFFTALLFAATLIAPHLFYNQRDPDFFFIIKSLLFIPSINPDIKDITPFYTIGWTLIYEMYFYFLIGIIAFIRQRSIRFISVASLISCLALYGLIRKPTDPVIFTYTNPILFEFLFGVSIAFFREQIMAISWRAGIAAIALSLLWLLYTPPASQDRFYIYGIPSAFLVAGVLTLEPCLGKFIARAPYTLGTVSYSLYLSHPISQRIWLVAFTSLFGGVVGFYSALIYSAGAVMAGLIGGVVCYKFIEAPMLQIMRKGRSN